MSHHLSFLNSLPPNLLTFWFAWSPAWPPAFFHLSSCQIAPPVSSTLSMSLAPAFLLTLSVLSSPVQLRIFRLARWWPHFHLLLKIMWASLRALRNPTLLLVTASFIFTLVGMQLFQKDYKSGVCRISHDCELPRWHMVDFFHTFMLIVRTLRGQWIECLWDCMEVTGTMSGQPWCLGFFSTVVVVGYLLVSQEPMVLVYDPNDLSQICQYHEIGWRSRLEEFFLFWLGKEHSGSVSQMHGTTRASVYRTSQHYPNSSSVFKFSHNYTKLPMSLRGSLPEMSFFRSWISSWSCCWRRWAATVCWLRRTTTCTSPSRWSRMPLVRVGAGYEF